MGARKICSWEQAVAWLRNQPKGQKLVMACYYDDPLEAAAERFYHSEEWQTVSKHLAPYLPGRVLDIGAGRGISSYAFAKSGCQVTALEPDPSFLVGAKAIQSLVDSTQLPITIVQEYGEILPFPDNSFDIVYGRAVLHHADNLTKLCQEASRVLKPGGVFMANREHVLSKKEDLQLFFDRHPLHFLYGGENAYLLQEYIEAIRGDRLKLKKVWGPYESAINYAPMTQKDFQAKTQSILERHLGTKIATSLAAHSRVQKFCGWYISQTSNAPGRLYSFLAVKP